MTHLQKLKEIQNIENQHNIQKELLLEQITKINILYSECNGEFLEKLSDFIKKYAIDNNIDFIKLKLSQHPLTKDYEERRKIKLGQLFNEISSNLEEQNEENSGKSSIISDIPRAEEAVILAKQIISSK